MRDRQAALLRERNDRNQDRLENAECDRGGQADRPELRHAQQLAERERCRTIAGRSAVVGRRRLRLIGYLDVIRPRRLAHVGQQEQQKTAYPAAQDDKAVPPADTIEKQAHQRSHQDRPHRIAKRDHRHGAGAADREPARHQRSG